MMEIPFGRSVNSLVIFRCQNPRCTGGVDDEWEAVLTALGYTFKPDNAPEVTVTSGPMPDGWSEVQKSEQVDDGQGNRIWARNVYYYCPQHSP